MRSVIWGALLSCVASAATAAPTPPTWPAEAPVVRPGPSGRPLAGYEVQFKLRDGEEPLEEPGQAHSALSAIADRHGLRFEGLYRALREPLAALITRAESRTGHRQPNLLLTYRAVLDAPRDDGTLQAVARELDALAVTEWVHVEPLGVPPPVDLPPASDDYRSDQTYAGADPGIDADFAAGLGLDGAGLRIYDCEYGWDETHEDLSSQAIVREPNQTEHPSVEQRGWDDHGTAVVGIVGGADNVYGVTGMAAAASFHLFSEWTVEEGPRRAAAVAGAIADARVGDVVILEMQTFGANGDYAPAEYSPTIWQLTRVGTDAGVIVVAAAGNGAEDLDSPAYAAYRARGSSGGIIVGAGTADVVHRRLGFSTYGSRVDLQGWGTAITTLGYGDLAEFGRDPRQSYTARFGGTSGATPMVASAVALLQQHARDRWEALLEASALRDILVQTGVPQDPTSALIGPFPDVRAALAELDRLAPELRGLDLPPTQEGTPTTLTVTATRAEPSSLEITWTIGGRPFSGASVEYVPEDDGTVEVEVAARDALGLTARASGALAVVNVSPRILSVETATAIEAAPWRHPLRAADPGADELAWSIVSASVAGAEIADDTLTWTPTYEDALVGRAEFVVAVEDDDGGRTEGLVAPAIEWLDRDGDAVPDTWEVERGFDPEDPDDATRDDDGDGRTTRDEFALGTDPFEYDGPDELELISPVDVTVGAEAELVARSPDAIGPEGRLRFRWRLEGEAWQQSEPVELGVEFTRLTPGVQFPENARVEWTAWAEDAFVAGPVAAAASFLYSRDNEPAPVPRVAPARLEDDGALRATLVVTEVGADPEGTAVTVDVRVVRAGSEIVLEQTGLVPEAGEVRARVELPGDDPGALRWTARTVDADGVASSWAPPARLDAPEGCRCSSTSVSRTSPSGPSVILLAALALAVLARDRRRRPRGLESSPR